MCDDGDVCMLVYVCSCVCVCVHKCVCDVMGVGREGGVHMFEMCGVKVCGRERVMCVGVCA